MKFAQPLKSHYESLFHSILCSHAGSEHDWERLVRSLKRLNLTEIVTPAPPFSKFPWVRHPVSMSRNLFSSCNSNSRTTSDEPGSEAPHTGHVASVLANNWMLLLLRDCDDVSAQALLHQDAAGLTRILPRLAVNTATGRNICRMMLQDAVSDVLAAHPYFAEGRNEI